MRGEVTALSTLGNYITGQMRNVMSTAGKFAVFLSFRVMLLLELQKINRRSCTIMEKATSRAITRLKAATITFTFKTLLRHL